MKMKCDEVRKMVKYLDRGVMSITISVELTGKATKWLNHNGYKIEYMDDIEAVMISKGETVKGAEADAEIKVGGTTYEG